MKRAGSRALAPLVVVSLIVAYVAPRLIGLDTFVTVDEPLWLGRSANFFRALRSGELAHTYQMAHPGVLTMWAGAAAYWIEVPDWAARYPENIQRVILIDDVLRTLHIDPLRMMVAARLGKIALQAVFFGVSLIYIWRLFGLPAMATAGILIAFDPFLSGLDSLLHVDGLFAISSFAAILGLAHAVRSGHTAMLPWLVAGGLAACAWMQRSTGIILVAVLLACLAVSVLRAWRQVPDRPVRSRLQVPAFSGLLWGSAAVAVSVALLPALWVDPFGTMGAMWSWSSDAATGGHEHPLFFKGEIVDGDPGYGFYPVTLLWRLTPVTQVGVALFAGVGIVSLVRSTRTRPVRWWGRPLTKQQVESLAVLGGFAALILLGMTLGAKKFDRYILPVYPVLDLIAALGLLWLAGLIAVVRPALARLALPLTAGVVLAAQGWATASVLPYRLDYYNPLLGGPVAAESVLQMGWGQGAGEAVAWVGQQVEPGDSIVVQGTGARSAYAYFLPPGARFGEFGLDTPAGWYETDYLIAGIQQWQRDISPAYRLVAGIDPVHTVSIGGVDHIRVYAPRASPPPAILLGPTGCTHVQGAGLQLVQVIGRDDRVDLYWLTREADFPPTARLTVTFTPQGDEPGTHIAGPVTAAWHPAPAGHLSRSSVPLPDGIGPETLASVWLDIAVEPDVAHVDGPAMTPVRTGSECFYRPPVE